MEQKEIKINCPEGFEIDKENSTFECIKFKPIKKELPKTWKEFCENNNIKDGEHFIDDYSNVKEVYIKINTDRDNDSDRNVLPSKKLAEAVLALCQLIQLRDCYNDGWKPDWTCNFQEKFCIYIDDNTVNVGTYTQANRILAFETEKLRDEFLENFKDLIEIAKPLL